MNTTKNTKAIVTVPVDRLTVGTQFIPEGKKRPVTIEFIGDRAATLELYCSSSSGYSAHILSRYDTVQSVMPR